MFTVFALLLQELAGYTGGDASFLKEDFEVQLNKPFLWGSVSSLVNFLLVGVFKIIHSCC